MNNKEIIREYFNRLITLSNQIRKNNKSLTELMKIEKVLRTFTPKFDHIVLVFKESKNLNEINIMKLKASLYNINVMT